MSDEVLIVTEPDDTYLDGYRILLVDLTPDQSQAVSLGLLAADLTTRIVLYHWNSVNNVNWLLDKKAKCQLIIFNADSTNDLVTGFISAQKNSHYFGNLKLLASANNSKIYSQEDCTQLVERMINNGKLQ